MKYWSDSKKAFVETDGLPKEYVLNIVAKLRRRLMAESRTEAEVAQDRAVLAELVAKCDREGWGSPAAPTSRQYPNPGHPPQGV